MAHRSLEIEHATEVFVRGFCAEKSRTHPYEHFQVGRIWVMRDAQRKNPKNYRKEEWIAYGVEAGEVDAAARNGTRGRFFVCAIPGMDETDEALRAGYKALGYRLLRTEPFFVHRLTKIPRAIIVGSAARRASNSAVKIERVTTPQVAEQFGKATRTRPIEAENLKDGAFFRQYVALENAALVGWVRSVNAADSTWCSNMYVKPSHRRRGIGSALLARMLRDDRARGAIKSVLLASHTGALVYPRVGYEQIGLLFIFAPQRK